jgi:hypothetical protein
MANFVEVNVVRQPSPAASGSGVRRRIACDAKPRHTYHERVLGFLEMPEIESAILAGVSAIKWLEMLVNRALSCFLPQNITKWVDENCLSGKLMRRILAH